MFIVKLIGKSATGCQWLTLQSDLNKSKASKIIKFVNYTYESAGVKIGRSLITNVNFDVIGDGTAKLNLYFARSWELEAKDASNSLTSNDISKIISIRTEYNLPPQDPEINTYRESGLIIQGFVLILSTIILS